MVVLLVTCLLAAASASPTLDPHVLELKQHYEHVSYIASYPCHAPQHRVFPVHQLFTTQQRHGKAYYPDVTVLHECGSAGSCTSGHHCVAVHTQPVKLPFKITFLQDMEGHEKGSWLMEYHELLNHTECGCAAIPRETSAMSQSGYGGGLSPGYGSSGTSNSQLGYGSSGTSQSQLGYGSSGTSQSQLGYGSSGTSDTQPGYGGSLSPGYGSSGTSQSQLGYSSSGTSNSQLGYGSSQLSPSYGGSADTLYTSIGYRLGDSSDEDNSTSTTTEAADVITNQVNNDTLIFKE